MDYFDFAKALALQAAGEGDNFVLEYPTDIADRIGLNVNEINSFKGKGCRFYGRKTCVAWVRDYLSTVTASLDVQQLVEHHQHLAESKSDGPASKNGSPAASLVTR